MSWADDLAKKLGTSRATIYRWKSDGAPISDEGANDIAAIKKWRDSTKSDNQARVDPTENASAAEVRRWTAVYRRAKAMREINALKKENGELVDRASIEQERVGRVIALKRGLEILPRRLAPRVIGMTIREAEAEMANYVRLLLEDYSRAIEPQEDGPTGLRKPKPA